MQKRSYSPLIYPNLFLILAVQQQIAQQSQSTLSEEPSLVSTLRGEILVLKQEIDAKDVQIEAQNTHISKSDEKIAEQSK